MADVTPNGDKIETLCGKAWAALEEEAWETAEALGKEIDALAPKDVEGPLIRALAERPFSPEDALDLLEDALERDDGDPAVLFWAASIMAEDLDDLEGAQDGQKSP